MSRLERLQRSAIASEVDLTRVGTLVATLLAQEAVQRQLTDFTLQLVQRGVQRGIRALFALPETAEPPSTASQPTKPSFYERRRQAKQQQKEEEAKQKEAAGETGEIPPWRRLKKLAKEQAEAGSGLRFTNGKDATAICIPQYKEGFLRLMAKEGTLAFGYCGWGDAEVRELAAALAYAHAAGATTQADRLRLDRNKLTDASVPVLVELLASGAVPKLKTLYVFGNELSESAKEEIKAAGRARGVKVIG